MNLNLRWLFLFLLILLRPESQAACPPECRDLSVFYNPFHSLEIFKDYHPERSDPNVYLHPNETGRDNYDSILKTSSQRLANPTDMAWTIGLVERGSYYYISSRTKYLFLIDINPYVNALNLVNLAIIDQSFDLENYQHYRFKGQANVIRSKLKLFLEKFYKRVIDLNTKEDFEKLINIFSSFYVAQIKNNLSQSLINRDPDTIPSAMKPFSFKKENSFIWDKQSFEFLQDGVNRGDVFPVSANIVNFTEEKNFSIKKLPPILTVDHLTWLASREDFQMSKIRILDTSNIAGHLLRVQTNMFQAPEIKRSPGSSLFEYVQAINNKNLLSKNALFLWTNNSNNLEFELINTLSFEFKMGLMWDSDRTDGLQLLEEVLFPGSYRMEFSPIYYGNIFLQKNYSTTPKDHSSYKPLPYISWNYGMIQIADLLADKKPIPLLNGLLFYDKQTLYIKGYTSDTPLNAMERKFGTNSADFSRSVINHISDNANLYFYPFTAEDINEQEKNHLALMKQSCGYLLSKLNQDFFKLFRKK